MDNRIIIIDGNSLLFRAYYAMQNPMITKEGIYTQGIFGFLNMLEKIKKDHPSGYIAVAFDLPAPTFRHKAYEEYKAGRKKMPPELAMEIPFLKDILEAMNITMLSLEGFEADDIIGTVARQGEEAGLVPLIITGDKDELQLATDITKVLITKKGISEFHLYDKAEMINEYGFTPTQFIDYKGLMGDSSDNYPGLPGVGPKTAKKMILDFGSVEGVLANTDKLKGKLREKVEENKQLAIMSKRLATIHTNVPLDIELEDCKWTDPNVEDLVAIYKKLEFNKFLKSLTVEEAATTGGQERIGNIQQEIITDEKQLATLQSAIKTGDTVVLKLFGNNDHHHPVIYYGAAMLVGEKYYYVDLSKSIPANKLAAFIDEKQLSFVGHDLRNDYYMLLEAGSKAFTTSFDTAVCQYVLDSGRSRYDFPVLIQENFQVAIEAEEDFMKAHQQTDLLNDDTVDFAAYGLQWVVYTDMLRQIQEKRIVEEELEQVLYQVEVPLVKVMASMEYQGFSVDRQVLEDIGRSIATEVDQLTEEIYRLAGEEFNIKSPKQLGPILFEKLGLPAGKKTKTGYSTSADVLEKIADKHEIIPLILEYRQLTKLQGTYIDGMIPLIHEDGKIHARFNQTVAATGRISSSEPNLQNIPVRQELGRSIRKAFVTDSPDEVLIGADYSQIELRVLAHLSGDPALIDSFNNGEDIHRSTAARVLGIPENEITPLQRSRAKAINFGVIYGMSAFGLSNNLHISRKEADSYIAEYFSKHQAVKDYMDGQVEFCKNNSYVLTITGRKRYISEIGARNFMTRQIGERLAMNSPIQGSAADIIKLAMIGVYRALENYESRLILQVHDELIIRVAPGEEEEVRQILLDSMEQAMNLVVDLAVDLNRGSNWYQLK